MRFSFSSRCPREELNLNLLLRRETSYPLNYEGLRDTPRLRKLVYYKRPHFVNGGGDKDDGDKVKKEFLCGRERECTAADGNDE